MEPRFTTDILSRRAAAAGDLYANFASQYNGAFREPSALQLVRESGIPRYLVASWTFRGFDPESPAQRAALETLQQLVRNWDRLPRSVFIHGQPRGQESGNGVGKSHLLVATAVQLMELHRVPVRYRRMAELISHQVQWYRDKESSISPFLVARNAPVLALDDMDKGAFDPMVQDGLYRDLYTMLDYRFDAKRPTLITSNYTPGEVEQWLGTSVGSRLSHALEVLVTGRDRRSTTNGTKAL